MCQWIASNCRRIGNYPDCYCDMTLLGCYKIGWPCCNEVIKFWQLSGSCAPYFSWWYCTYDRSGDRVMGGTGIHECEFSGPAH
jgi:hypothetical protein